MCVGAEAEAGCGDSLSVPSLSESDNRCDTNLASASLSHVLGRFMSLTCSCSCKTTALFRSWMMQHEVNVNREKVSSRWQVRHYQFPLRRSL